MERGRQAADDHESTREAGELTIVVIDYSVRRTLVLLVHQSINPSIHQVS